MATTRRSKTKSKRTAKSRSKRAAKTRRQPARAGSRTARKRSTRTRRRTADATTETKQGKPDGALAGVDQMFDKAAEKTERAARKVTAGIRSMLNL